MLRKWTSEKLLKLCCKGQPGHPERLHREQEGCETCHWCALVPGDTRVWCARKREMVYPDDPCFDRDHTTDWSRMARYVTVDRDTYRSMLSLQHDDGREHVGLIGSSDRRTLDRFAEDRQCTAEPNECRLSEEACTVFHEWQHSRVRFAGLMHTHPEGRNKLSPSDMAYAQELMRLNGMACMLMGILTREELCMYLVHADGETEALEYMIC